MSRNEELKKLLAEYRNEYERQTRRSWEAHVATLPDGTTLPPKGKFYDKETREALEDKCREIRAAAAGVIDERRAEIEKQMTEAPSGEAVNMLQALKLRGNVTAEELQAIAGRYGSNYQTAKAIEGIAEDNKIRGFSAGSAQLDAQLDDLQGLANSFGPSIVSGAAAERGRAGAVLSFIDQQIDAIFPEE